MDAHLRLRVKREQRHHARLAIELSDACSFLPAAFTDQRNRADQDLGCQFSVIGVISHIYKYCLVFLALQHLAPERAVPVVADDTVLMAAVRISLPGCC